MDKKKYKITFLNREVQGYSILVAADSKKEALKLAKEHYDEYEWWEESNTYEGKGVLKSSFEVEGYWEDNKLVREVKR